MTAPRSRRPPPPGASDQPVVLLVEDEHEARASLARTFRREGFGCIEAADVSSARTLLAEQVIDVCVIDLVLGDDDRGGITVLQEAKEIDASLPCVLITAFADVTRLKRALNLGASYLLEKPFRAAELVGVVRTLLPERRDLGGLVSRALSRANLTAREDQIARLVLKGLPSAEIASVLGTSDKTVRQQLSRIYEKCGVSSRAEFFHYVFPF
ncbi:C4-dicarboxylate transport transcriptional regulatory protein [Labilithrix luteola]|uniref:C4-dicarboxylate transport transcriptional regulatory protein n=1 Tax=Labilithrix luteola TaxID=1391654 RepID=A0A0K1PKH0_9BACT|nr:response regulator transcription factor [Labilithrix luteola]AKU94017.1 C4-dicarboxylate transport transcriptional regulatory protein [Labilithrix luteola]